MPSGWVPVLAVLGACGRIGFDVTPGDGGLDRGKDAVAPLADGAPDLSSTCLEPGYGDAFDEAQPCSAFGNRIVSNGMLTSSNGTLALLPNANQSASPGCIRTNAAFGDAGAFVEVSQALPTSGVTGLVVQIGSEKVGVFVELPWIAYQGPSSESNTMSYDPIAMRWWRIRPSGGELLFETAPDGRAWTPQLVTSSPTFTGPATITVGVDSDAVAMPGTATLEGIDVCPP